MRFSERAGGDEVCELCSLYLVLCSLYFVPSAFTVSGKDGLTKNKAQSTKHQDLLIKTAHAQAAHP